MRRYRQPPPPPRSSLKLAGQVVGWILLGLLVAAGGVAGGAYLYAHETLNALGARSAEAIRTSKDRNVHRLPSPTGAATALVIGYDTREGSDARLGQQPRSDTIMLVRADPSNETLSLLSFPRDLVVSIYCHGSRLPYARDPRNRINAAWADCGEQGTLDTVAHLTKLAINYVITVDFHGFKLLVNKLHGVYTDVDHRYYIPANSGTSAIDLEPGYQKLDGGQALAYVRFRHTDSDLYRNARQQLFLDAFKDRLSSGFSLTALPGLIGAVKHSVEIVQAGGGAPSISTIQAYVGLGYHLPPGHLFRISIPNLSECGYLNAEECAKQSDIGSAVKKFMHPDPTQSQRANDRALGIKHTPQRAKTSIQPHQPAPPLQVHTFDPWPAIAQYQLHLPFRILAPRVLASGSNWTSMEPVRPFKPVPGHPELRELVLTFVTAAGNVYYSVVETNWPTAPILRHPTDKLRDKKTGRTFLLFTTSGNIHMIAFRRGKATYWLFNTLRDELSNTTMVAIARSLQPAGG
jgi:polyisoprenyl-teichoic acid--peptidoglycan teichoic acid transferase